MDGDQAALEVSVDDKGITLPELFLLKDLFFVLDILLAKNIAQSDKFHKCR